MNKMKMNKINWTAIGFITIIALLVFQIMASLSGGGGHSDWGMMGHRTMMGGRGFSPFEWAGAPFMWIVPIGFVVLIVLGVVWLARNNVEVEGDDKTNSPMSTCPSCGYEVQTDWDDCPCCNTELSK